MALLAFVAAIAVAVVTRVAATLIARHGDRCEQLRRWSGGTWVTVGDEAEHWLHDR